MTRRLGAYVLPGDPVWMTSSLLRYYDALTDLVVVAPRSRRGWTGRPIPVDECLAIVERLDVRGIAQVVWGDWSDPREPLRADTAQRQAGVDALADAVDWVIQVDNDEVLPRFDAVTEAIDHAEARGLDAVDWPMRVLYRRLRHGYLEVCARDGQPRYDYPGPIAVRAGTTLTEARRTGGPFLRPVVAGDTRSADVAREPGPNEVRLPGLSPQDALLHNSWGREPADVARKIRTWGHAAGLRGEVYYWTRWRPAPLTWRWLRSFHPAYAADHWPRLRRVEVPPGLLVAPDH